MKTRRTPMIIAFVLLALPVRGQETEADLATNPKDMERSLNGKIGRYLPKEEERSANGAPFPVERLSKDPQVQEELRRMAPRRLSEAEYQMMYEAHLARRPIAEARREILSSKDRSESSIEEVVDRRKVRWQPLAREDETSDESTLLWAAAAAGAAMCLILWRMRRM